MKYLAVLRVASAQPFDGVADYADRLVAHLAAHVRTTLVVNTDRAGTLPVGGATPERDGVAPFVVASWRELWRTRRRPPWGKPDAWVFQYVPQLVVSSVEVIWLLAWLLHLRLRRRADFMLTVHEYNVPWGLAPRRFAAWMVFETLFLILALLSTRIVVTHGYSRRQLHRLLFWKRRTGIAEIPVGSNIPLQPISASPPGAARRPGPLVCVIFGQPEAMSVPLVMALGRWLEARLEAVCLRWVGRSRDDILAFWTGRCGLSSDRVEVLAGRSGDEVAQVLRSSDLCIAPLADGVSARRTTVVAALGHGLPIVGTDAKCTDPVFRQSHACLLSRPSDDAGFVCHVALALEDPGRRLRMAGAARKLFEDRFTWDRIALAYLAQLAPNARAR